MTTYTLADLEQQIRLMRLYVTTGKAASRMAAESPDPRGYVEDLDTILDRISELLAELELAL